MSSRACKQHGFTLIELLVVFAVISILAGILLPVFASARLVSKRSVCQSNLRQLYMAFDLYASDWDETFPCPGGQTGSLTYWAQEDGGGVDAYLKNQSLNANSVFCCPCYRSTWNSPYGLPRSYGMNSFLREPEDRDYPGSCSILAGSMRGKIKAPTKTILLYEGYAANSSNYLGEGYVYRCGDWTCVRGYHLLPQIRWQEANETWHGERNNYLMCDGHIMSMRPEKNPFSPTEDDNFWYARKLR